MVSLFSCGKILGNPIQIYRKNDTMAKNTVMVMHVVFFGGIVMIKCLVTLTLYMLVPIVLCASEKFVYNEAKVAEITRGAQSEISCLSIHCVNGGGCSGVVKYHACKKDGKVFKIIYTGYTTDSMVELKNYTVSEGKIDEFDEILAELQKMGIFEMEDIDLEKLPVNELADNPWEDSFYQLPRASNFISFEYFIRCGDLKNEFFGIEIEKYRDRRYVGIVNLLNKYFKARLGCVDYDNKYGVGE